MGLSVVWTTQAYAELAGRQKKPENCDNPDGKMAKRDGQEYFVALCKLLVKSCRSEQNIILQLSSGSEIMKGEAPSKAARKGATICLF